LSTSRPLNERDGMSRRIGLGARDKTPAKEVGAGWFGAAGLGSTVTEIMSS